MNLSSSSEDEGYSSNDSDIVAHIQKQRENASSTSNSFIGSPVAGISSVNKLQSEPPNDEEIDRGESGSDSDAFDDVDWEDASVDEWTAKDDPSKPSPDDSYDEDEHGTIQNNEKANHHPAGEGRRFPSKAVVINFEENTSNNSTREDEGEMKKKGTRKRRRTRIHKIQNVPQSMKALLRDLQRVHLLSSISRSIFLSSTLGDTENEIWSIAHSLIPAEFILTNDEMSASKSTSSTYIPVIPTYDQLQRFSFWFFDFVHGVEHRREQAYRSNIAQGAPLHQRRRSTRRRGRLADVTVPTGKEMNRTPHDSSRGLHLSDDENITDGGDIDDDDLSPMQRRIKLILAYLSPTNDGQPPQKPLVTSPLETLLIFICMTRCLGWRVRLATSLDPIKQDLTVDHPFFSSTATAKSTFRAIAKSVESSGKKKKKRRIHEHKHPDSKREALKPRNADASNTGKNNDDIKFLDFAWAEVLHIKAAKNGSKSHSRWTHIDPNCSLFDEPLKVESIDRKTLKINSRAMKQKSRSRYPVSYVIGVEHFHHLPHTDTRSKTTPLNAVFYTARVVDITPRYANKWSLTLKHRGANAKELASGKCANRWWSRTLKRTNHFFLEERRRMGLSAVCLDKEVKHAVSPKQRKMSPFKIVKQIHCEKEEDVLIIDDSSEEEKQIDSPSDDDLDDTEEQEFASAKEKEAIPTSKAAFKNHPLYVIPSVLKSQEVLAPDARKRICGLFKGEMVYKRSDASKAYTAKKWLYNGRKVLKSEISKPAKIVAARKKPTKKGFQALESYGATIETQEADLKSSLAAEEDEDDGKNRLFGIWQTQKWSPPYVGPNDAIPVNEHKNVELELLNPGLVHLDLYKLSKVAKQLGVPYAPCLLGFEGHGGNRTPTIRGIVVHEHNAELLREAHVEMQSQLVENECKERQRAIYTKWKRLIKGVLTKERLAREYAND